MQRLLQQGLVLVGAALVIVASVLVVLRTGEQGDAGTVELTSKGLKAEVVRREDLKTKGLRTTQLKDALEHDGKITWEQLRPEHPAYYPDKIYLFSGKESMLYGHGNAIGDVKGILRKGHPQTLVKTFPSLRVNELRAACWDEGAHVIVFPSFAEYPDLHMISKTDIKGYASGGNNVVFMGGYGNIDVINEIFGWQLRPVAYQDGPFYKSNRNVHNTVFETTPTMLSTGRGAVYGVHMGSLPPGARSYYDSLGDSVVWSVRYDLGMVTYIGSDISEEFDNAQWHQVLQAAVAI